MAAIVAKIAEHPVATSSPIMQWFDRLDTEVTNTAFQNGTSEINTPLVYLSITQYACNIL